VKVSLASPHYHWKRYVLTGRKYRFSAVSPDWNWAPPITFTGARVLLTIPLCRFLHCLSSFEGSLHEASQFLIEHHWLYSTEVNVCHTVTESELQHFCYSNTVAKKSVSKFCDIALATSKSWVYALDLFTMWSNHTLNKNLTNKHYFSRTLYSKDVNNVILSLTVASLTEKIRNPLSYIDCERGTAICSTVYHSGTPLNVTITWYLNLLLKTTFFAARIWHEVRLISASLPK